MKILDFDNGQNADSRKADTTESSFLVLVPHRDARNILRGAKRSAGVLLFPCVAPLAQTAGPVGDVLLKETAHRLRLLAGAGGVFTGGEEAAAELLPGVYVSGPRLRIDGGGNAPAGTTMDQDMREIIAALADAAPLAAFVIGRAIGFGGPAPANVTPPVRFRAASIANMVLRTAAGDDADFCSWEIGPLFWLPKTHKVR